MTPWLVHELRSRDLDVTCLDARHARAALKMQINKTDQNDAEGLAQIMRPGWYRQVIRGPSCPRAACCAIPARWPPASCTGALNMTFWHGFASLPCSIPDGNGYRPRFKPVSVGSIRQYISQLHLARTNRGMCGCASGLARQSPDRQQSIDRDPGRGSPYESQVPCAPQRAAGGARVPRAYPSEPCIFSFPAKCRYATGA